ncbi:rCG44943 [Rattus norvegicus]|uniref:RCG44943 n=1 Tax=Rattus norvegicus TaxID=10116 RepID=A6KK02_RAT|nr:rCG44943 [Rattus norvegicus]
MPLKPSSVGLRTEPRSRATCLPGRNSRVRSPVLKQKPSLSK